MTNCKTLLTLFFSVFFLFCFLGTQNIEYRVSQEVHNVDMAEMPNLVKIPKARPFQDSFEEKLKFNIVFQNIIAGKAVMIARSDKNPQNNGRFYFEIKARTARWVERIYSLRMSMLAYVDPSDFSTVKYIEEKEESGNYYYTSQYFSPQKDALFFSYRKNDHYESRTFMKMIKGVSVPAAFYFSRTVDLDKIGTTHYIPVAFRDKVYPIGVEVISKERVKTSYGMQNTIMIRPIMKFPGFISGQKDMLIYLSDDEKKIPLLMVAKTSFGYFKAYLVEGFTPAPKKKKNNSTLKIRN